MTRISITDWHFKAEHESQWLPAVVPGCVHIDLLRNNRIPDPFYGTHEHQLQWIDKQNWVYEAVLCLTEEWFKDTHLTLTFTGLDTYADVYVNDVHVLSSDNMFRTWVIDVKEAVQLGENRIRVMLYSPIQTDLPKCEQVSYPLPAPNDQSELGEMGDRKLSVWARKAPYHYGWDWGPRFVTSGIWRKVRLESWSEPRLQDLFIRQDEVSAACAKLTAVMEIEADQAGVYDLQLTADQHQWTRQVQLTAGHQTIEWPIEITDPRLWWCNGLGKPELTTFHLSMTMLNQAEILSEQTVTTGLRSIRLITEPDEAGHTFYFELNGKAVFIKGANHIPNDSFLSEVTASRYLHEIETAVASLMNMLRVWGGGVYEDDQFYQLCDQHGLLVWQDFMFACSMYPGNEEFLHSIELEARDNVKRLRNHPSIALWCGNNEMDSAWAHYVEHQGWGWKEKLPAEAREELWAAYEAIFHRILPEAVEQYAPGAYYWPSSPLAVWSGDAAQHTTIRSTSGDMHYWGVWHESEAFERYNQVISRFMSEYGFQSFPEYSTVRAYAEEQDLQLESDVMLAHQKNNRGNQLIKQYMDMYMKPPKDFPSFLNMSQILQSEAIQTAITAHRRHKPYCMGSLYWQLNDCWPVASWSSMDYFGRWKALQYGIKRSFQPLLLSIIETDDDQIEIHLISDVPEPVTGELHIELLDHQGHLLRSESIPAEAGYDQAKQITVLQKSKWLYDHKPYDLIMRVTFIPHSIELPQEACEAIYYFARLRDLDLIEPEINVVEYQFRDGTELKLSSNVLARHVRLSTEMEGHFSDNDIDLIPGMERTIRFYAHTEEGFKAQSIAPEHIQITSMYDYIMK